LAEISPPAQSFQGNLMERAQAKRAVAAGMIGNMLEWYDFAVYGYFAAVIGRH
jgi:MHS family proline/betaine transporter-like MFS transporter